MQSKTALNVPLRQPNIATCRHRLFLGRLSSLLSHSTPISQCSDGIVDYGLRQHGDRRVIHGEEHCTEHTALVQRPKNRPHSADTDLLHAVRNEQIRRYTWNQIVSRYRIELNVIRLRSTHAQLFFKNLFVLKIPCRKALLFNLYALQRA